MRALPRRRVPNAYQVKTPMVCGEVNGKTRLGGYSGYQGFTASGKTEVVFERDFKGGEFAKVWNEMCCR